MATLTEQLLNTNAEDFRKLKTGVFKSKRLQELLGAEDPVEVKICEIPQRRVRDIISMQLDRNGNQVQDKVFDAQLISITVGVTEPNLKDKELMAHFKVQNTKELAEVMFGSEVTALSDTILELSGIGEQEDDEETLKN